VIGAPRVALRSADCPRYRLQSRGEVGRVSGTPSLIGDDLELPSLVGEPQDGLDEVRAELTENPRCTHDDVLDELAPYRDLAVCLAAAVNTQRGRFVGLDVRPALGAVEDVVGRDVNQRRSVHRACARQVSRPLRIYLASAFDVRLCAVDGRIRRRIHDDPSILPRELSLHLCIVGDVQGRSRQAYDHRILPGQAYELGSELAGRTEDQNLHDLGIAQMCPKGQVKLRIVKLAVSVDLDEVHHYYALHGLAARQTSRLVYERAIARLVGWADQRRLPLTWFVVGQDLEVTANSEIARGLANAGHELGCHSYSHFYDLTLRPAAEMRDEIERGVQVLERATGCKVFGFRAPGYVVTDTLLSLLSELELSYDSSVFPCPSYFALKAVAVHVRRAQGGSQAILDGPGVLSAPIRPYRVGRPYWHRGAGIWELPIQVTRRARLPFIGTSLALAGKIGARVLARGVLGEPLVNLELHGIDALDQRDGLHELARRQPGLSMPWNEKLEAIDAAVKFLLDHGYRAVSMKELADHARSES